MNVAAKARLLAGTGLLVGLISLALAFVALARVGQMTKAHNELVAKLNKERTGTGAVLNALGVPGGKVVDELANPVPASALPDKFTWRHKCWVRVREPVGSPDKLASLGDIGDLRFPSVFRGWRCEHFEVPRRDLEYVKCSLEGELVWYRVSKEVEPSAERVPPRRRL